MSSEKVRVWDFCVRVFHWSLVVSFSIAYLTEDEVMWLHEIAGYTVLFLVIARAVWGFIGTKYARFSSFVFSPATVLGYLKDILKGSSKRYLGHNPLGGSMVIVLFIMLSLTSWTGILLEEAEQKGSAVNIGFIKDANADENEHKEDESEELLEEVHEVLANLTLILVFVHIGGVIFSSFLHHENLVRSMLTGLKRKE